MTSAERSVGIDLVRVLGIVAVVAGHVWSDDLVRVGVYSWHVPLFFFLTGYLWTSGRSVRSEVRRRSRALLRPYLVWLGLIAAVWVPSSAVSGSSVSSDVLRLAVGGQHLVRPFSAFWFITALFACAVLMRVLERFPTWVAWTVAVSGVVASAVAPGAVLFPPLSIGTAVPALVFVLVGRAARSLAPLVARPSLTGTVLIATAVVAIVLGVRPLDLKHADFGTPVLSIAVASAICTGAVFVAGALGHVIGPRVSGFVTALATSGIGVVLTHAVVIWVLSDAPQVLVFAAATALPWTFTVALLRTPAAPWVLGAPARRIRVTPTSRAA